MTALCGTCEEPLDPNGRSLYFCSPSCQDLWMVRNGDRITWNNRLPEDDHALSERIRSRLNLPEPGKEVA
jgi:hypothetical protein